MTNTDRKKDKRDEPLPLTRGYLERLGAHLENGGTLSHRNGVDIYNELMRVRDDAARYQWLRSRDLDAIDKGGLFIGVTPDNLVINFEDADARIDAAILSEKDSNDV